MSIALFEVTDGSGGLILLDSGLEALEKNTGKVNLFLTISGNALISSDSCDVKKTISFELAGEKSGGGGNGDDVSCSHCVIDLTPVVTRDDLSPRLLSTLGNLLALCSGIFVHFDVEDNNKNIESLSFFNALLEHFDNNISVLQRAVALPPLHYYTRGDGLNAKASKRAVDKMLLPEKGFSEEIGKRNCTRNILSSMSHHKELIQLHGHEGSIVTHSDVIDSMEQVPPKLLQCLDLTGGLLVSYLPLALSGDGGGGHGVLGGEDLSRLVAPVLQRLLEDAYTFFTRPESEAESKSVTTASNKRSNNSGNGSGIEALVVLSPAAVMRRRARALDLHQTGLAASTPQSLASRKLLQSRMRGAIEAYRAVRLARVKGSCEEKLAGLMQTFFTEDQRDHSSSLDLQLKLGESGNVYSQFLTFKNALEKIVHVFLAVDTAELLSEGEINEKEAEDSDSSVSSASALSFYSEVEEVEASVLKHEVLYAFVSQQARLMLQIGDTWVGAYEALAAGTEEKTQSLRDNTTRVESELETLIASAINEKEEAGVRIVALMDTFEIGREEQTRLLEQKQLELDRLVSGLDRTTRLNVTDKEDLTNELMKVQERIQEAQNKSLELRQERENQTSSLHNDLLEEERKGHRWFRSTIAKQRALLSEELALERQVNQTKSQQMEQNFSLESEHIRNLEKIRTSSQQKRQSFRDDMFRQREHHSQEHDNHMAALRQRNMELDSKLSAANYSASESKHEEDKGCVVM